MINVKDKIIAPVIYVADKEIKSSAEKIAIGPIADPRSCQVAYLPII